MMVGTWPSFRYMSAPCLVDKSLRAMCGRQPNRRCMFPINGSFHGPGGRGSGRFLFSFDDFFSLSSTKMKRNK